MTEREMVEGNSADKYAFLRKKTSVVCYNDSSVRNRRGLKDKTLGNARKG